MASNACWGIEVGAGGISAMKLAVRGEGVQLLDFAVVPHKRPLSTPEINEDDVLRVTLGQFVNQVDLTNARLVMSLPGHAGFARFAKLPPVEPRKVGQMVQFEAKQQIPFPLEDVEWDFQTFVSSDSPEIEVGIFAVTKERLALNLRRWADVGLTPDVITLSPLAAFNAVAFDLTFNEKTPGTIIVDIGTTSTDLIVSEPGRAWVRTFPIGGHHFTEAIASQFNLAYPKAEKLKREFESTKHASHVLQAMRSVMQDLAQDIQRSIGYYQTLHADAKLTRLIGVGSTFRVPGLVRFLKSQLQIDVFRVEDLKQVSIEGTRATELADAAPNLMTAYGLALQGLDKAALVANLMPTEVSKAAMWKRKVPWFAAAAGLSLAATGAMFIRPTLDRMAINANPEPPSIRQVVSNATNLKGEAGEVTAPASDYSATTMLSLLDVPRIYERLTDDVSAMLENADEVAGRDGRALPPGSPAFELLSVATKYVPPKADADEFALEPVSPSAGTIEVTINLATLSSSARDLMIDSIDKWLRDHKVRTGVPYRIEWAGSEPWKFVGPPEGELVVVAAANEQTGQTPNRRFGPPGQRRNSNKPIIMGGGPTGGAGQATTEHKGAENFAPIEPIVPQLPQGTKRTRFVVRFDAVLLTADKGGSK